MTTKYGAYALLAG